MKKIIILFLISLSFLTIYSTCFALETNCPNLALIDGSNGRVIYDKNAYEQVAPASTTKIMTAIIVLEKGKKTDIVTASYDAIMSVPSRRKFCSYSSRRKNNSWKPFKLLTYSFAETMQLMF